ncbi:aspartyl-phosphate phosphatase Spo0E family protein [Bacillus mycoides]|uniref:aspartyl-phosphate phosphatase Spo0E family protein n=1 Tax=Bacillus mycoides TaxID=1405 RepID=UPI003A8022EA
MDSLHDLIEERRSELAVKVKKLGVLDDSVVKLSQELDGLIMQSMSISTGNQPCFV